MTVLELAFLVAEMRKAQKHYFRTRGQGDLEFSKQLEKRVDKAVEEVIRQPALFDLEQP